MSQVLILIVASSFFLFVLLLIFYNHASTFLAERLRYCQRLQGVDWTEAESGEILPVSEKNKANNEILKSTMASSPYLIHDLNDEQPEFNEILEFFSDFIDYIRYKKKYNAQKSLYSNGQMELIKRLGKPDKLTNTEVLSILSKIRPS